MRFTWLMAVVLTVSAAGAAQATTFVWKDPQHGYTMSFPDSWRVNTPDQPDTRLRVAGPVGEDRTTCRMQVDHDGRAQMYTKEFVDEYVSETLNRRFWELRTGEMANAKITSFVAPASMGDKGDASAIHVSFLADDGSGQMQQMRGVMFASLYADKIFVTSCSTRAEKFGQYAEIFGSILNSVQFDGRYHPYATGYYRNFLMDPKLVISRLKPGTSDETCCSWMDYIGFNR